MNTREGNDRIRHGVAPDDGAPDVGPARFQAQMLVGNPGRSPLDVVGRLLAVQAQDPRGARLAVRARSTGLRAADVDAALTADRSLVLTWLNRGTLHLVRSEDYAWLHALTTPSLFRGNARRLAQEGVTVDAADRGVRAVEQALAAEGPMTRSDLRKRVSDAGVRTEGQALVHVLMLTSLRGSVVRGPMVGGEQAYVLVRDWLGPSPPAIDGDAALGELARRYLAGHGPASDRDLARWAGLPLRDARRGLSVAADALLQRPDGLLDLRVRDGGNPPPNPPPPRLLGSFEPVLLGWTSREQVLGVDGATRVISGGLFRPFALVEGHAVATWAVRDGRVTWQPFAPVSDAGVAALDVEADDVVRFLGLRPGEA